VPKSPACHPLRLQINSSDLDPISRFCAAHPFEQHTDRQTMLRATSVAAGNINTPLHACQPPKK